ncbi:hypothetical protein ACWCXC_31730 [Streptomyces sp. NPDC001515]
MTTPTPADELRDRIAAAFRSLNEGGGTLADLDEESDVHALADAAATVARQVLGTPTTDPTPEEDTIGLCGYCGEPREGHHHGYVSTAAALAAAPHRVAAPASAPAAPTDWVAEVAELRAEVEQWRATFGRDALPGALRRLEAAEAHRLALSEALGLGTGAPWDAIRDRAAELRRLADEAQPTETERCTCADAGPEFAPAGHYADCPHAATAATEEQ